MNKKDMLEPIEHSARVQHRFLMIHPFSDYNGRVARLLWNYILMKNRYLFTIIDSDKRSEYLDALQRADDGNFIYFLQFITTSVLRTERAYTKNTSADGASTNTTALMNFALTPLTGVNQISTSSDIPTNTGSIHVALLWSPNPLASNTQSTLKISFYDATGTAPLTNTNVKYNLIIYDKNNHPVITKQNLLAKNAAGTKTVVFPAAQIYHMQVQITGLLKPGQTPDFTRNGVATGYVVVPEFPAAP